VRSDTLTASLNESIQPASPHTRATASSSRCATCAIAARFASDHADRLSRLVLVDTFGLGRWRPSPRFALTLTTYLTRPTKRKQDRFFRQCFVDLDGLRERAGGSWSNWRNMPSTVPTPPSQKAALRSLMPRLGVPPIPPEDLARIAVPTTLIWGRHDRQVRLRVAEVASVRHDWPLQVIENAADDPASEQPGAFLAALRNALGVA
jgi:pimeloyl-ACP methyl ester carboxylesterase